MPDDRDAILASTLTPPQAAAFRALPVHDQAHLCAVYRFLRDRGVDDREVLTAGLLHDLGKVSAAGQVRLVDRAVRVVLARLVPGLLRRWARVPAAGWRLGLALAVHHPALGAERAAALGASPRVCWLIAHHEDAGAVDDRDLRLLAVADREAE